jgi:glycyl-tRNA synthetase beta chain
MSEVKPLLIEIGCEELPPKALDELSLGFANILVDEMQTRYVSFSGKPIVFATPRRLAVLLANVPTVFQPMTLMERIPLARAFNKSGQATPELLGRSKNLGIKPEDFSKEGSELVYTRTPPAEPTSQKIAELLPWVLKRVARLPNIKPMRWGDHDYAFVRPVHWIVVLHGDEVIDVELFGIRSGRQSRGHRFHHPQPVHIADADSYLDALRAAKVLVDPQERRKRIAHELGTQSGRIRSAAKRTDLRVHIPAELLNEVANLTEWPTAISCSFDSQFLVVPHEALSQTMRENQKFFPVYNDQNSLTEHFVGVANIDSKDPSEIRRGYERVIRPRFADAKFFYDEDLKTPLSAQQEALKTVTYQQQLGSVWDKCLRVIDLSRVIANRLGVDAALATHAASLSKCDLMTRMVGEFPELQGVMGRYYATADGENAEVARALDEFYKPRFAGDDIATGKLAQVLAVAERLDTLAGIFAVGQKPSGNKDPFALRRAALGLGRTLIEGALELNLEALFREALELLPKVQGKLSEKSLKAGLASPQVDAEIRKQQETGLSSDEKRALTGDLGTFIFERLRGYYAEQGFGAEQFEAVRAIDVETLIDFDRRLRAVAEFSRLPEAQALAAANKRIGNILRQAGGMSSGTVEAAVLDAGAETDLHRALVEANEAVKPLVAASRYVDILRRLAALREPVDRFFDGVMVMADDAAKRNNRLVLLSQLRRLFLHVADISLLPAPERTTGDVAQ